MNAVCIIFGLVFIAAGILFAQGRLHVRLKAWKMMSDEERQRIDIRPLCINIGGMIALAGSIFLVSGFLIGRWHRVFSIGMIIYLIIAASDLYYIERSGRYTV